MASPAAASARNVYTRPESAKCDPTGWPPQAHVRLFPDLRYTAFSSIAQYVDPIENNVIKPKATFRTDALALYNPTNTTPPFFQVFHCDFVDKVLGGDARVTRIAHNPDFAFAHEAPIYLPATDELTFASNAGGVRGFNGWDINNRVSKISMAEAEAKMIEAGPTVPVDVTVTKVHVAFAFGSWLNLPDMLA